MAGKATVGFQLTEGEAGLFKILAQYYETTMTDLLRQWIYEEATAIVKPDVDQMILLGIDGSELKPKPIRKVWRETIRNLHVQQYHDDDIPETDSVAVPELAETS